MPLNSTSYTLIKGGIFVFLLTWAVLRTRKRYAGKLSWKDSALLVLSTMLLAALTGTITSIVLIVFLKRWVNEETLENIVLIISLGVMYVVFKYLEKRLESRLLKNSLSDDD